MKFLTSTLVALFLGSYCFAELPQCTLVVQSTVPAAAAPKAKTCPCSPECTCGCNQGYPCECYKLSAPTYYYRQPQYQPQMNFVPTFRGGFGGGIRRGGGC